MPPYILAADIGTTHAKALAVTREGYVLASHQISYPTHFPGPLYAEQDPVEILEAVKRCLSTVVSKCKSHTPLCLTFSAAMHSLVAVDNKGTPLTNLIIWSDVRSEEEANALIQHGKAKEIYEATGTPMHPMLPLFKLMWLHRHQPEVMSKAFKFLSIKDFVVYHLTGQWVTDFSVAGASGLFHLPARCWNQTALVEASIHEEQLPTLISTTEVREGLRPDVAAMLGLKADLKFTLGASDGPLANLGTDAVGPEMMAVTVGTSAAVRMVSRIQKLDNLQRTFCYFLSDDKYVIGGASNNGAVLLQWFEEAIGKLNASQSIYEDIEHVCRQDPYRSELLFLPYVLGERAPIYDANARGTFFGLNRSHTKGHMLRAVLEGICFALLHIAGSVRELTGEYHILMASGGFVQSPAWLQLLSNIFGKEVRSANQGDASAIGAARLAFHAIGEQEHFFERSDGFQHYFPDGKLHPWYDRKHKIFLSLYPKLKQEFYNLSKLNKL